LEHGAPAHHRPRQSDDQVHCGRQSGPGRKDRAQERQAEVPGVGRSHWRVNGLHHCPHWPVLLALLHARLLTQAACSLASRATLQAANFSCIDCALLVLACPLEGISSFGQEGVRMARRAVVALAAIIGGLLMLGSEAKAQQKSLKSPGHWAPEHPYNITP